MEGLYDILEINKTKNLKIIKKAYITKVKMYPPETHPKEFEKIRDAYERLSKYATNESSTIEVISEETNDVNKYIKKAQEFFKLKEYDRALIAYERALLESNEKTKILNEIGVIYIYKDEVDKAISKFEEVLKDDSKSDVAYANLGDAYLKKESYDLALVNYEKAFELNNSDEYLKSILDTYVKSKDTTALLDSLNKLELVKGDLISYYISCINLLVEFQNEEKLKEVLKILVENVSLNIRDSKEISEQLYRTSLLLYKNKHYKISNIICEYGLKIYELKKLDYLKKEIEESIKMDSIEFEIDRIKKESRLDNDLVSLIIAINTNSSKEVISSLVNRIYEINYEELKSEIEVLRDEYKNLYKQSNSILETILISKKSDLFRKKLIYTLGYVLGSVGIIGGIIIGMMI